MSPYHRGPCHATVTKQQLTPVNRFQTDVLLRPKGDKSIITHLITEKCQTISNGKVLLSN